MSDRTAVKIMITVQWEDSSYADTRISSDAVTTIEIVEVGFIREKVVEILAQAALKTALDEWVKKEVL